MKRIYKYLWRTNLWGLCYQSGATVNLLEVYLDVDFESLLIDSEAMILWYKWMEDQYQKKLKAKLHNIVNHWSKICDI
jgi:hypothetical protein